MNFVTKIRMAVGNAIFLKQVSQPRKHKQVISFEQAKKIGMLYDATNEQDYEMVKQYIKGIRADHKEVFALGYVDKKQLPVSQFAQLGLDFFTKKDLKWNMIPDSLEIRNFINEQFDILINLNEGNCFPLNYITAMSKAKFRIGRYHKKNLSNFDFLIEAGNSTSLSNYIKEVDRYLRIIKS